MILEIKTDWKDKTLIRAELVIGSPYGGVTELAIVVKADDRWRWFCQGSTGTAIHKGDAQTIAQLRLKADDHDAFVKKLKDEDYKWVDIESITTSQEFYHRVRTDDQPGAYR